MSMKILFLIISLLASNLLLAAPLTVDISAESVYDSNLSQTPDMLGDDLSGMHTRLATSVRKGFILSEDFSFMAKLGAEYHDFNISESADYWSLDAVVASTYKPFEGFSSPQFKASASVRHKNYRNDYSSDEVYRLRLSMYNQITSSFSTDLGMAYRWVSNEWAPIDTLNNFYTDTSQLEYFLSADLRFDVGTLYSKLSYKDGDHIWTRPAMSGFMGDLWDDAEITTAELGFNLPIGSAAALDLLGRYYEVRRNGAQMYDRSSVSLAYMHRFSF